MSPVITDAVGWLRESDSQRLEQLWQRADSVRRQWVGDAVHLRGLLEISNYCDRSCWYCGLRLPNPHIPRYRMTADEILEGARGAVSRGYGTLVMQAGEDPGLDVEQLAQVIRIIKAETPLAVTLSLGERTEDELRLLRRSGADRYLLRFETSNERLLETIHPLKPGEQQEQRRELLGRLREFGFEVGSGVMIGLPGQTLWDLARDIDLFQQLDLDMIGVGPYIPHPDTPLYGMTNPGSTVPEEPKETTDPGAGEPARADELTTYKMIALARLACPRANIPSTTALATINPRRGQLQGLQRGANVIMPNLTPQKYRRDYEIYPNKAGSEKTPDESEEVARQQLATLGRPIACGRGDSPNVVFRRQMTGTGTLE